MIYLLHGSDIKKSHQKLRDLVSSLIKKKPDASHERLTTENFEVGRLDELISSAGLFSAKAIIEADRLLKDKETKELVLKRLKEIAVSENIFIFLESELDKKTLEKFEKLAEKVQEFNQKSLDFARDDRKDFNVFSITHALARRDRKQLWVIYTKARLKDIAPEEIHGILFWQVKKMSGAKDLSSRLVSIYHEARRGKTELDNALERFILEV